LGDACATNVDNRAVCAAGLRCFAQHCTSPGSEGDGCDFNDFSDIDGIDDECAPGLTCDCRGNDCINYYCEPARFEYEPCDDTHVCLSGIGLSCIDGLCRQDGSVTVCD
jgi:hypothetical protein